MQISLYRVKVPLKSDFANSHSRLDSLERVIAKITCPSDGGDSLLSGWGEAGVYKEPNYLYETPETCLFIVQNYIAPALRESLPANPAQLQELLGSITGYPAVKACFEMAFYDIWSQQQNQPLNLSLLELALSSANKLRLDSNELSTRTSLKAGATIGIAPSTDQLREKIEESIKQGYTRIKLKVDSRRETVESIKSLGYVGTLSNVTWVADCNGAFSLASKADIEVLKLLDTLGFSFIEQPLAPLDFVGHRELRKSMDTPICLDESIDSPFAIETAYELCACDAVSVKLARTGSFAKAIECAILARAHSIDVWCGAVHDLGIGKLANIALASLSCFSLPGDLTGSNYYFHKDILDNDILVEQGRISVPNGPEFGIRVNENQVDQYSEQVIELGR